VDLADQWCVYLFYDSLLYLPTIWLQFGHVWMTSLREGIQNGMKQHPSHSNGIPSPINSIVPQTIHDNIPVSKLVAVITSAEQYIHLTGTGTSLNIRAGFTLL